MVNGYDQTAGYLGAGQLGAGLYVGGELCVVAGQVVCCIGDTGDGIGASLGYLLGKGNGFLHLPVQPEDLAQGLEGTAVGDLLLLGLIGAGANVRLQVDDAVGGADDFQVGIDQIGYILAGIDAAGNDIGIVLQSAGLDAHNPLEYAVEALNAAQSRLNGPPRGRKDAEHLRIEGLPIDISEIAGLVLYTCVRRHHQRLPGASIDLFGANESFILNLTHSLETWSNTYTEHADGCEQGKQCELHVEVCKCYLLGLCHASGLFIVCHGLGYR